MTLEEAIRFKELTGDEFLAADPDDLDEADRLSIEAIKQVKESRFDPSTWEPKPLPGETNSQ